MKNKINFEKFKTNESQIEKLINELNLLIIMNESELESQENCEVIQQLSKKISQIFDQCDIEIFKVGFAAIYLCIEKKLKKLISAKSSMSYVLSIHEIILDEYENFIAEGTISSSTEKLITEMYELLTSNDFEEEFDDSQYETVNEDETDKVINYSLDISDENKEYVSEFICDMAVNSGCQ